MTETSWHRVEGMIIAHELNPREVAKFLQEKKAVAQIEWYEATPQLVGIRVATNHEGRIATLDPAQQLNEGPKLSDLAEDIAAKFLAEVMLGEFGYDRIPGEHSDYLAEIASTPSEAPLRIVEIGTTPGSAIPLLAALEGLDLGVVELGDDKRALLAQLPPERAGWYFGDVPLVTMTMHDGELQVFFIEDDDPENVVTYNWGMTELTVAGERGTGGDIPDIVHELVGARPDIDVITDAVAGSDADAAFAATGKRGPEAVVDMVRALGLPEGVAAFLLGVAEIEDLEDVTVHRARGVSNAIGRTVDMMLEEKEVVSDLWDSYSSTVRNRPWVFPLISATEAAIGISLLTLCRGRGERRSFGKKLGTFAGVALMIDSVAELSLAKYVGHRQIRAAQEENIW